MIAQRERFWPLPAGEIASICAGRLIGDADAVVQRLALDTRGGIRRGDLFVALRGARYDAAQFVSIALRDGAQVVVCESAPTGELPGGTAVVVVPSALDALQQLAAAARATFGGTLVAITGSNGKTIVKDMLQAVLGTQLRTWASPMSWNSQVGVAASLLAMDPNADVALVECGISQPGEMSRLANMVSPDLGVFINIGTAHLENFSDRVQLAEEKAQLFALPRCRDVFVAADQQLAIDALHTLPQPPSITLVSVFLPEELPDSSRGAPENVLRSNDVFAMDAQLVAAVAAHFGLDGASTSEALRGWVAPAMRLEVTTTPTGVVLINDAYVSDPVSAEAALRTLVRERGAGQTIAVLGGFAQLGAARAEAHRQLGRSVAELGVDRLVAVGPWASEIVSAARAAGMAEGRLHETSSVADAAQLLQELARAGDRVLLKGSRPERLEVVAASLFDALAPTRLVVDLDRIRHNFSQIQRHVGVDCGVIPVVKAFGYGLDAARLAHLFVAAGAIAIAVAYPDEGLHLRERGVTAPILVQNVVPAEVEKVVRAGLTAVVPGFEAVAPLEQEAARQGRRVRVHLKVDTGMGRLGVVPADALKLAQRLQTSEHLVLDGLMTHIASSESPAGDLRTTAQLDMFDRVIAELAAADIRPRLIHAANSSAVARHPRARYSAVRAGIGLLGYADNAEAIEPQQSLRLVTQVIAAKELPEGHSVGYGATYTVTEQPRRIAVVALGYADGYPIALSSRGFMQVQGVRCPVVGRVCMDVCMLDVTAVVGPVLPGDEVVVFGFAPAEPQLTELAQLANTISYQILTALSPRIRRIFVGEW